MLRIVRTAVTLLFLTVTASFANPTEAAVIRGTVTDAEGQPVERARVVLVETDQSTLTDTAGSYRFEDVSPGRYHLRAEIRGRGTAVAEIKADEGDNVADMQLSTSPHQETIIVTATRSGAGSAEIVQPANVLDSTAVTEKMQPTLGEMLGTEAGVSQTFFGAGTSRPIIRGLEGGRVRMLEHGLGTGDVSDSSPDHAVAIDPVLAEQIEVIRGAATLLYGSSAVGGVVNMIDRRVPERLPQEPLTGILNFRLGSVADERMGAADLNGRAGNVAWHLDAAVRETDDYEIPGFSDVDGDGATGTLPNSDLETQKWTGGLSYVWEDKAYLGASFTRFDTKYGIPGGGHEHEHEEEEEGHGEEEGGPRIDLEQERIDLRAGVNTSFGPFNSLNVDLAGVDYVHQELEGTEIASVFDNEQIESRIEIHNGEGGALRGTVGLQYLDRDLEVSGEEAFLPPSQTENLALFALERLRTGPLNWDFGLRFETQDNKNNDDPSLNRDFDGVSGSLGLLYRWGSGWGVGGALNRSDRLPNNEELYSDGAHLATGSFEVGDPDLDKETAQGAELTLRRSDGRIVNGSLNLFYTRFDDYIFQAQQFDPNGEPIEVDGLPLFVYRQRDSEFYGYELELLFGLLHDGSNDLDLIVGSDQTTAELRDTGEALPRIPPQRYTLGLDYRGRRWSATAEAVYRDEVTGDDVAPSATPTGSSTVINASVSRRFMGRGVVHTLMLRGTNLTDEDVRLNTSRLKDSVPLPGVDVSLIYRLVF